MNIFLLPNPLRMESFIVTTVVSILHNKLCSFVDDSPQPAIEKDVESQEVVSLHRVESEYSLGFEKSKSFSQILSLSEVGPFCFQYGDSIKSVTNKAKDIARLCDAGLIGGMLSYAAFRWILFQKDR